jgi:thiol:disulfide interchange protein
MVLLPNELILSDRNFHCLYVILIFLVEYELYETWPWILWILLHAQFIFWTRLHISEQFRSKSDLQKCNSSVI